MKKSTARNRGQVYSWPAPVRGWVTNQNIAAAPTGSARVLDNGFPDEFAVRVRGGSQQVATIGSAAVTALLSYVSASAQKLFACSASAIYDVSAFDATTAPTAAVSSLTGGSWAAQQITTAGGTYLLCANGADSVRLYDGSAWTTITGASTPAITGVTTSLLGYVWLYRERIWFLETNTLRAWYLPVGSIGGAASSLSVGGVAQLGGKLMFGATWSLDSGDGIDDKLVLVTDQGEALIYQGAIPTDADWSMVGRFQIGRPMGAKAHMRAGGDLIVATEEGLISIASAIQQDRAALALTAVSRPIEPDWRAQARQTNVGADPWSLVRHPRLNMLIAAMPHTDEETYVVNLRSGAWARYTGWDIRSIHEYLGEVYFGDDAGEVWKAESTGYDGDQPYTVRVQLAHDALSSPALHKQAQLMRVTFRSPIAVSAKVGVAVDYSEQFSDPPDAVTGGTATSVWDAGLWDTATWDAASNGEQATVSTRWRSVAGAGFSFAPQVQVTIGSSWAPSIDIIAIDLLHEVGAAVT